MDEEQDDGAPPDLVWKLVFPFLEWKELLRSVELVCTRWRRIAGTDTVWKPYCDAEMKLMQIRRNNAAKYHPDAPPGSRDRSRHTIMRKELQSQPRRPYRDILILSQRMGKHYVTHEYRGPDAITGSSEDGRSLRGASLDDLRWIVLPTIEVLRNLFGEPRYYAMKTFSPETLHKREMKNRLLELARKDPKREAMFKWNPPEFLEKKELARLANEYLLAAATLQSHPASEQVFHAPSTLSVTFGEMVDALSSIVGKETSLQMSVRVKHTPQGFHREFFFEPDLKKQKGSPFPDKQMGWPLPPNDAVHFLIKSLWPSRFELERPILGADETWDEDEAWDKALKQWWSNLTEPIRETLVGIYRRNGTLPELPQDTTDMPLENIRIIAELPLFRLECEATLWKEIAMDTKNTLLDIYLKKSGIFLDAIRREYSDVYGDGNSEMNAKALLEIFLEVPPHPKLADFPDMTKEHCQSLFSRIEDAFNRWNELIAAAKSDEAVRWNPQTLVELVSLESKFNLGFERHIPSGKEFDVNSLVTTFLYSVLAPEHVPEYYDMRPCVEKLVKDIESMMDKDGDLKVSQHEVERRFSEWQRDGVLSDFTTYRDYVHVREHAMLALVPLLQHLSCIDSKKLIYAAFIQCEPCGFSDRHFGKSTFWHEDLPCGQGQDFLAVVADAFRWIKDHSWISGLAKHGTLQRLFGLPLPRNIVAAMADFLVERLYQHDHPSDVDLCKGNNALEVLPYLERTINENPENCPLVWECLERAIQNAIHAVEEFGEDEIWEKDRETYTHVILSLVSACIRTRALRVVPTLRNVYEGTQFAILTRDIVPLDALLQKLRDAPPIVLTARSRNDL